MTPSLDPQAMEKERQREGYREIAEWFERLSRAENPAPPTSADLSTDKEKE